MKTIKRRLTNYLKEASDMLLIIVLVANGMLVYMFSTSSLSFIKVLTQILLLNALGFGSFLFAAIIIVCVTNTFD